MKLGWTTEKLENVCVEITDGSHFSPKTSDDGYPYITVRDIVKDKIDFNGCRCVSKTDFNQLSKNGCKPRKGDILFSKDGTVGKVAIVDYDTDFVVLSSLAIVRPDTSRIDSFFLKYVLQSPAFLEEAIGKKTGVAIRRIILRNLKSIPVHHPPLSEQQRIVAILDEAFEGIATAKANAEKNLKNARALLDSYLNSVFSRRGDGWVDARLGDVCGFQNGFAFKSNLFSSTGHPILRISNIQGEIVETRRVVYFQLQDYRENLSKYRVVKGDLLIAMSGATTGKIGFNTTDQMYYLNQRVGKFEPKDCLSKRYLFYFLSTRVEKNLRMAAGAAQPNLSTEQIKDFDILLPPLSDQYQIVGYLDALREETRHLESIYRKKIAALDALKKSILHKAFSGEL